MNAPAPPERPGRFFQPVNSRTVAKTLPPALLWAYVAAVVAALVLGAVALLTLVVAAIWWVFNRDLVIGATVGRALGVGLWIAGPLALGAAVGAAAYASTKQRSLPRSVLGTLASVGVGAALLALGSSGVAAAALALGWAVAIPADGAGRVAARGLPLLVAGVGITAYSWGRIEELGVWRLVLVLVASPLIAAVWVWLADAGWMAVASLRSGQPNPESGNRRGGSVVK